MSNSNHSAKFINMLIALMASIAIALTCIVPTALAQDGDGTDDNLSLIDISEPTRH